MTCAVYKFGSFRLETGEQRLLRDGEPVKLRAKVFATLQVLLEHHGRLVSKDQMVRAVWPDAVVEEGNLAHNVTVLRKALGEGAPGGQWIETVPGKGYRFLAPVQVIDTAAPAAPAPPAWQQRLETVRAALATETALGFATPPRHGHVVGRERELAELASALDTVRGGQDAGRGLVLCIAGEPGIGKSTLAFEFAARELERGASCAIAAGRCSERLGESEAYLPVFEALESLVTGPGGGAVAELMKLIAPTWYLQVAPLWATADPAFAAVASDARTASRERMKRELAAFLEELGRIMPVVLFLDDVHWADASTTELLSYLAQRLRGIRMLVLAAYRSADLRLGRHAFIAVRQELQKQNLCREIQMDRLSPGDVASYVRLEMPDDASPAEFAGLVYRHTEGNPLFMADVIRHHRERGPAGAAGGWERDLPESVRSMIQRRIALLAPGDLTLLGAAAVQGPGFDSRILADLLDMDAAEVEERLQHLDLAHDFVRRVRQRELPDGSLSLAYIFSHVLYQHAIEESLAPSRRAAWSGQSGQAILRRYGSAAKTVAAELAFLFEAARDYEQAADWFLEASANAARLFANEEAVRLSSRAIANAGKLEGAARHRRELAAWQQIAQLHLVLSQFPQAVEAFERAEKAAEAGGDIDAQVNAICAGAVAQFNQKRTDTAREYATRALGIAQAAGSELGTASAELVLGLERMCFGNTAAAAEHFGRSVPVLRKHGPPLHALEAVGFAGLLHAWQLDYKSADDAINWTLQRARDLGLSYHVVMNLFVRGMALFNRGRLSEGFADLWEGMRLAEKNRERYWLSRYPNTLGWAYRELGDYETALKYDAEGAQTAHENGYKKPEANSHVNLAHNYLALGELPRALEHLRRAEQLFDEDIWFRWRYNIRVKAELARFWLLRGDTAQAARYAQESMELAAPRKARKHLALGHRILGDIATAEERFADARREYDASLTLLGRYRCPVIEWTVLASAARMTAASKDTDLAERYRGRCRQVIDALADSITDSALRTGFLRSEAIRRAFE